MLPLLLALTRCDSDEGVGGFVKIGFPYTGSKAELLSQLSIVVKTPQGSIVDEAEVQPTGYWIIPTPTHHEIVVHIRGPDGLVLSPAQKTINYPYSSDINFMVLGFSITGSITTRTASGSVVPVSAQLQIDCDQEETGAHYKADTTEEGKYSIGPVAPGVYTLKIKNAIAEPKKVVVTDSSAVCEPLLITDWPQRGNIVFPEGVKARKVHLKVSGEAEKEFETDNDGYFMIKDLNVGRYYLECTEKDVVVSAISFTVSSAELPTPLVLNYVGVNINGKVVLPNKNGVQGVSIKILPEGKTATTNENGEFVLQGVKPCEKPEIVAESPFMTFNIPSIDAIATEPLKTVEIGVINTRVSCSIDCSSAQVTISGAIEKKFSVTNKTFSVSVPYGKEITINVQSSCGLDTNEIKVTAPAENVRFSHISAKVSGSVKGLTDLKDVKVKLSNGNDQYTINADANGNFASEGIEFGTYAISVLSPSNMIWKETKTTVAVNNKNVVIGEIAHQTAFRFHLTASHQMKVAFGKQIVSVDRGTNVVETTGTVVSPADCHIFEPFDVRYNTRIVVSSIEREIIITGEKSESNFEVFVNQKPLAQPYKFTQGLEETVTAQVDVVSPYYVEPARIEVHAPQNCDACGIKFEILRGKEYKGKIFPSIEGVVMTATCDGKVLSTVSTSASGEYSFGSHPSNMQIVITAHKMGYNIKQRSGSLDFDAEKLASFTINFESDEAEGTLVSLTKGDGFRKTERVSHRVALFNELPSGEYTINPVKREYRFTPKMKTIKIGAGEDASFNFSVKKTRFGISGKVTRITGEPEPDVEISTVLPSGEKTSDVTNADGYFRLGNLLPNQTYTVIAAATGTSSIKRITPEAVKVVLGQEDSEGLKFMSIKASKSYDILGEVDIDPNFLESVTVILTKDNGKVESRYEFESASSNFFFFSNLTDEHYTLTVANKKQLSSELVCEQVDVSQTYPNANVVIKCEAQQKVTQHDNGAIYATVYAFLALLAWVVFFNINAIKEALIPAPKKKRA